MTIKTAAPFVWIVEVQSVCDGYNYGKPRQYRFASGHKAKAFAESQKLLGDGMDKPDVRVYPPEGAITPKGEVYAWREF